MEWGSDKLAAAEWRWSPGGGGGRPEDGSGGSGDENVAEQAHYAGAPPRWVCCWGSAVEVAAGAPAHRYNCNAVLELHRMMVTADFLFRRKLRRSMLN